MCGGHTTFRRYTHFSISSTALSRLSNSSFVLSLKGYISARAQRNRTQISLPCFLVKFLVGSRWKLYYRSSPTAPTLYMQKLSPRDLSARNAEKTIYKGEITIDTVEEWLKRVHCLSTKLISFVHKRNMRRDIKPDRKKRKREREKLIKVKESSWPFPSLRWIRENSYTTRRNLWTSHSYISWET